MSCDSSDTSGSSRQSGRRRSSLSEGGSAGFDGSAQGA